MRTIAEELQADLNENEELFDIVADALAHYCEQRGLNPGRFTVFIEVEDCE